MSDDIELINVMKSLFGEGSEIRKGSALVGSLYDSNFEVMKWMDELPYLQFPANWQIKIIPPFVGATVRFLIKRVSTRPGERVSVYFDAYNNLAIMPIPYWELYPDSEGDNRRFLLGQEEKMIKEIEKALDRLEK